MTWWYCSTCGNHFPVQHAHEPPVVHETEKALLVKLERVLGYVPVGTKDLLHVLTHPDVIDLTEEYVRHKRLDE